MFSRLASRLIAWSLVVSGTVYVTTIGLSNRAGRRAALAAAEREASNATDAAALEVEGALNEVDESVGALARAVSELSPASESLARLVRRFAADESDTVFRYDVFFEDTAPPGAPPWFRETLQRGAPLWTEPYYTAGDPNVIVITRTAAVRDDDGRVVGVAGATLRLDFISAALRRVRLGRSGFALALSREGLIIGNSQSTGVRTLMNPVETLPPALRARVEPVVRRAEAGQQGFVAVPLTDNRLFRITVRPLVQTGGVLATLYAEDELLAEVLTLQQTQIFLAVGGLLVLTCAIVLLSRRITGPLADLATSARELATGNLAAPLPAVTARDEIGELRSAFRDMRDSLQVYIRDLQQTTAAKEKIEGELNAARRIQKDLLPPPTAGGAGTGYELAAMLLPARAVGGDLYAHFAAGPLVYFLVGDVSGKGVPAALFMARTKTLFDAVAVTERDPGAMLDRMNRSLCTQNEAGMYVTAVCGVLDVAARTVTLATAGHEAPLLVRAGGTCRPLETPGGRVLGLIDGGDYPATTVQLQPGDAIVASTDGVSEAQDPDGEFFGTARLLTAALRHADGTAASITAGVVAEVKTFARTAPQSDDVTVLTLKLA